MSRARKSPPELAGHEGGSKSENKTSKTELSHELKAYTKRQNSTKQQLRLLSALPNIEQIMPIDRIKECSNCLKFKDFYTIKKAKLAFIKACHVHLVCSQCAKRRAIKYGQEILLSAQQTKFKYLQFITLTVKNSHDPNEVIRRLLKALNTLMGRFKRQNVRDSITNDMLGGVWVIEITYNAKTGYHPHVHGIIASSKRIYSGDVRAEWKEITKGESFICDSTLIKHQNEKDLFKSILEISKYTLKNTELPPENMRDAYMSLKGKRLIRRFGSFKGKPIDLNPDLTEFDNLPFFMQIYNYLNGKYVEDPESGFHYENEQDYQLNRKSHKYKKQNDND